MGTSLSGLTPATTFDGLLKVGDNEPLDGTLKAISTGEGTDTILSLSDSALTIGGNTSVSGSVNTSTSNALTIQNSDGTQLFAVRNDGRLLLGTSSNIMYLDDSVLTTWRIDNQYFSGSRVGIGISASGSHRLFIKGSGATSATTSLLVQNSAGNDSLKITDDNGLIIGNSSTAATHNINSASSLPLTVSRLGVVRFTVSSDSGNGQIVLKGNANNEFAVGTNGNNFQINDGANTNQGNKRFSILQDGSTGIGDVTPTARLHVKGLGNDGTTASLLVQNSDGTDMLKVTDDSDVTLSKLVTIRNSSAGLFARAYADGYGAGGPLMWVNGSMNLGSSPSTAAKLSVKGSGATSATTALLVENSAGTDLFKVDDSGASVFSGLTTFNNNVSFKGANSTSSLNNLRFVVPGSAKSLTINKDYSFTNDASALVDVQSTTQGFLPPRMTTTERDAISSPASGLMVYNTTTNKAQCYNGTAWQDLF